jgi:fructuronate reductase/mannitol 2-dehydrogenase
MKRIILPVVAWLLAVREGASESGQPYQAKDTQSAVTAIQEGAVISGILGLENCQQTEVVDIDTLRSKDAEILLTEQA